MIFRGRDILTALRGKSARMTSDNKWNKQFRLSLAEMSITRISFIQHIHGNLQGKRLEVGPDIQAYVPKRFFHYKHFTVLSEVSGGCISDYTGGLD